MTTTQLKPASLYKKRLIHKQQQGIPTALVNAHTASEHVTALLNLGWSAEALSILTGRRIVAATIQNLHHRRHQTIEQKTRHAIITIPYRLDVPPTLPENTHVPVLGAKRRIQALQAIGWAYRDLHAHGIEPTAVGRGVRDTMRADRWRDIADVYTQLCMTPGPTPLSAKRAGDKGWASPLAWNDIDDPDETPMPTSSTSASVRSTYVDPVVVERLLRGERIYATRAEEEEAVRRVIADPEKTLADFAQQTHLNVRSIAERLHTRARRAA